MQRFLKLAAQHQAVKTPFLLMDRGLLEEKACEFSAFAGKCKVFYAAKANADPAVIACLSGAGIGFEISTQHELKLLKSVGIGPERIISSNPVKEPGFIKAMCKLGIRQFVFDSTTEAHKLAQYAPGSEVIVRLAVDNSGSSWPLADKFAVEPDAALELLLFARTLGLVPVGITFHVGSQCTDLTAWSKALQRASELWERAVAEGVHLRVLNIGGGFPAHHNQVVPSAAEIFELVFSQVGRLFPHDVELVAEPGRGLVADAGVLVSSVIGEASREDGDWLYLDVGVFNGLMEAVGNVNYSFWLPPATMPENRWTIAGPSCDSLDVIARGVHLREADPGERVLIFPGGAYTTAYASRFNGASIPKLVLA